MIMNRVVIILGLVFITGYVIPDLSRAHRHVFLLPEDERQSLTPTEPAELLGPVLRSEVLSQRAEQPSWGSFSLAHTDTHHLPGSVLHHHASYRYFNAPDGVALIFSWAFGKP
jgi:hypothetical protein